MSRLDENGNRILVSRVNLEESKSTNLMKSRNQTGRPLAARSSARSGGGWNTGRPTKPKYVPNAIRRESPPKRSASAAPSRRSRFQGLETAETSQSRPATAVKKREDDNTKPQRPSTEQARPEVTIEIPGSPGPQTPRQAPEEAWVSLENKPKTAASMEINGLLSSLHRQVQNRASSARTSLAPIESQGHGGRVQSARAYGANRLKSCDGMTQLPNSRMRVSAPAAPRGWVENRPFRPNMPAKCSDRTVEQPLLQEQTKQLNLASKKHAAAKAISESLHATPTPKTPMSRSKKALAQTRWRFATCEVVTRLRNAKELADELLKDELDSTNADNRVIFSKHGDYLLISKGKEQVRVADLNGIAAGFDALHPDEHGHVPYSKILSRMGMSEDDGGGKSRIMNRAPVSVGGGHDPGADARAVRAANRVFNFEDMLKFQFPAASWSDIRRMANTVAPGARPLGAMSREKILEGVQLFKKMDPKQTGLVNYDNLEEVLIKEYPRANVYKIIKTMDEEMLDRLFGGGDIGLKEFVLWYGRILTADWKPNNQQTDEMARNRGTLKHKKMGPHTVLGFYVNAYPERQHFAHRLLEEAQRVAFEERATACFIKDVVV